jgi:anti-sigma factor RsiW
MGEQPELPPDAELVAGLRSKDDAAFGLVLVARSGGICHAVVELVSGYLDQELDPASQRRFEAHLAGCTGCARYADQVRLTVRLVGRPPPPERPAEAFRRFVWAMRSQSTVRRSPRGYRPNAPCSRWGG